MTGGLSYMQARRCLRQSSSSCQLLKHLPRVWKRGRAGWPNSAAGKRLTCLLYGHILALYVDCVWLVSTCLKQVCNMGWPVGNSYQLTLMNSHACARYGEEGLKMGGPPPPGAEDGGFAGLACITLLLCVHTLYSAARGTCCSSCAREAQMFLRWQQHKDMQCIDKCHGYH